MHVLHVYRTYFPDTQGGLEETIRQICVNTAALDVKSRVFCLSRNPVPPRVERSEATVYRAKQTVELASCGMSFAALREFNQHVEWADVVHYHFPWPFADLLHFSAKTRKPTVLTYHSDIVRQQFLGALYRPLMDRFLTSVDSIACTSPNYFATSDVLSHYENKVEVIPIGIDEQSYPNLEPENRALTKDQYGENFFLFVGVLRYYKGLHLLLDAIVDAPYRVIIVGSGPTEQDLKEQAKRLSLTNVCFAGNVSDTQKMSLFDLSKAVVFPSYLRAEAFGVTLLEGAMFGKPLISTEVGSGTSHVNKHEETGLVVTPGSASALRSAMDKIHEDSSLAQTLGRNARSRFEQYFTGQLMGERYHQVYRRLTCADGSNTRPLAQE